MKKFVFKKWVTYLLLGINLLSVMFMSADYENMLTFHLVHIVAFIVFIINTTLILRYGKKHLFE